jgi:D-sedoheptulose 7-phosphate isomerase
MGTVSEYIDDLQQTLARLPQEPINEAISVLHSARLRGRQVFIVGNGGSASTASHFACDLAKNTRKEGWPHFRVLAFTDNMALMTAYANDEGYENVFSQQLACFVQPADVVIGISTSGNSPNVLGAIELANQMEATTIGFTGYDGGRLGNMVDIDLHVPSTCIEQVEDIHLMFEHLICTALRQMLTQELPSSVPTPSVDSRAMTQVMDSAL